ncbi:MAG: hypothetical protein AAGC53_22880 [Actinomycetota bacterium]
MARSLRLGIDMDGVLADFNAGWTRRYNRDFPGRVGRELTGADVVEWDAPVGLTHFTTMDGFWVWAETCAEGRSLFHGLEPYETALDSLQALADDGHEIVIVTTKPAFAIDDTYDWLDRFEVPTTEIHILDDKTLVDCDVYLDDAVHNLEALSAARPEAMVCRFVRPWNEPVAGTVDVDDWRGFVNAVRTRNRESRSAR